MRECGISCDFGINDRGRASMGLSGRVLAVLMVFMLLAGMLLFSWLFWGEVVEKTEQTSARLLEDTIKLAINDARTQIAQVLTLESLMEREQWLSHCEQAEQIDFCASWPKSAEPSGAEGKVSRGVVFERKSVIAADDNGRVLLDLLQDQLRARDGDGAGVIYWQQQPLWLEFEHRDGMVYGVGFVVTRLLDRWAGNMHLGMHWRWRMPEDVAVPWGMAEISLPGLSGAPISVLVSSSTLTTSVLSSRLGVSVVAVAGMLAIMVWLLFYRPLWSRMTHLLYQLRTILSQRDYSNRIALPGKDALSEVAQHCNGLLSALEYSHNLMAKTNLVTTELLHKLEASSTTTVSGVASDLQDGGGALSDSVALVTQLSRAIESGQLVMHYQPVVAMESGKVVSWEALCRWQTEDRGVLAPVEFLSIAEQSGQMRALLRWALTAVARDLVLLPQEGRRVSINLSHSQLVDRELLTVIGEAIKTSLLTPEQLDFEIREASLLKDFDTVNQQIEGLRALGVGVTVDGYGFGAHALTYLQRCPITRLKLSRVFSERIARERREVAFIEGISHFAAGLGASVVAMFIETDHQLIALRGRKGIAAQGYALAWPMPIGDAQHWKVGA
ncbi:Hypothetical protein HDN1F_10890 [gamma proteobacterium HdN1]|nr:Hypothetical protein HDN1F_10890 [gamma proteobacterium HdN1]